MMLLSLLADRTVEVLAMTVNLDNLNLNLFAVLGKTVRVLTLTKKLKDAFKGESGPVKFYTRCLIWIHLV